VAKKVWSSNLKQNVDFTFLRWSLSHGYNFEMNDNNIADQLRLVYRIMRFQRNNKWWWALFLWGYEVSMVNSYVMIKRYCEMKGVPVPWNHHDRNEALGYAHLDPHEYWPRRKSFAQHNHRRFRGRGLNDEAAEVEQEGKAHSPERTQA